MTMDELHGTLTAYEMRIDTKNWQENIEETFKSMEKIGNKEYREEERLGDESDEEEAYFLRRLKRGTKNTMASYLLNASIVVE